MKCKCIAAHIGCMICGVVTMQTLCVLIEGPFRQIGLWIVILLGGLTIALAKSATDLSRRMEMSRLQILQAAQIKIAGHSSNCGRPKPRRTAN